MATCPADGVDHSESRFETFLNEISPHVYPVTVVFVAFLCGVAAWLVYVRKKQEHYPPGPVGFPFIGYIPFLGERLHEDFARLAEKYGDIFHLKIGSKSVIVLSSDEAVRNAFEDQGGEFSGRGDLAVLRELWQNKGILMSENEKWSALRGFAERQFNQERATEAIFTELDALKTVLQSASQHTARSLLIPALTNVAMSGTLGISLPASDQLLQTYVDNFMRVSDLIDISSIVSFLPVLGLLPKYRSPLDELKILFKEKMVCIREFLALSRQEGKAQFATEFLNQKDKDYFTEEELGMVIDDIFGASTEATVATLQWAFYYMIKYPEIQRKVQAELDNIAERNPKFIIEDRHKESLPFTVATLQEIERCGSVAPFGVVHSNPSTASLDKYTIPPNSIVLPNLWKIHHDPFVWENPFEFDPDRFYSDSTTVLRPPSLLPYSIGNRSCPFQKFASSQLFLFFANIFFHFSVTAGANEKLPLPDEYVTALSIRPKDFRFTVESRFK